MKQKMVWKRLCYGETEGTANDTLKWAKDKGLEAKIKQGKLGYSVLIKAHSFTKS